MAFINNQKLEDMIKAIPNKAQRDQMTSILTGQIVKQVRCMSTDIKEGKKIVRKGCNGRVIADIYKDGRIMMTSSDGKAWLRASRFRLDGSMGFQCWCGNDSRLCEAEKGVSGIENNAVDKDVLAEVYKRLQKMKKDYPVVNGKQEIDGFLIEEV